MAASNFYAVLTVDVKSRTKSHANKKLNFESLDYTTLKALQPLLIELLKIKRKMDQLEVEIQKNRQKTASMETILEKLEKNEIVIASSDQPNHENDPRMFIKEQLKWDLKVNSSSHEELSYKNDNTSVDLDIQRSLIEQTGFKYPRVMSVSKIENCLLQLKSIMPHKHEMFMKAIEDSRKNETEMGYFLRCVAILDGKFHGDMIEWDRVEDGEYRQEIMKTAHLHHLGKICGHEAWRNFAKVTENEAYFRCHTSTKYASFSVKILGQQVMKSEINFPIKFIDKVKCSCETFESVE